MGSRFDTRELSDFARFYGFHYESLDAGSLAREILVEMERGLCGAESILPMIPSYIAPEAGARAGRTVLALDAGGTNLRACLVRFDSGGRAVAQAEATRRAMPGSAGRVGAEAFFDEIADAAIEALGPDGRAEGIGFTFSYHIDMRPDSDGVLMGFSKEIDAPEVVGRAIGASLREALARRGRAFDGPIALLNDTAATLLSGVAENDAPGPTIGFILGTGFNTAYPETRIPKIGFESREAPQIVVCETGAFRLKYRGSLDLEFDAGTKTPGAYALEKSISGAYLGPLTALALKKAALDGLIKVRAQDRLLALEGVDSREMNAFLGGQGEEASLRGIFAPDELEAAASARYIASILTERAALISVATLAATVRRIERSQAHNAMAPGARTLIAVEGTTYMAYEGMRRALDARLHALLTGKRPHPYAIRPVSAASLFGAAVAAATLL